MKYKLTKAEFDALSADQKELYKEKGGHFVLQIEGMPDLDAMQLSITKLEGKNAELLTEKQKEKQKADDAEAARVLAEAEAKAKTGDLTALNASWQGKVDAAIKTAADNERAYIKTITDLTSGAASTTLAAELAVEGSAVVLEPHIRTRLKTEYKDGKATLVVLDKDGKPSAMTLVELKEEFTTNPAFATVISGSSATGSGGVSGKGSASHVKGGKLGLEKTDRVKELNRRHPELSKG